MASKKRPQQLRIIAGAWRGRKLPVVDVDGLRPTMDRVRETLFNWLMFEVQGARVADLFAGTGALGIEALSRGAKSALFVERSPIACRQIEQNLKTLNVDPETATVACAEFSTVHSEGSDWAFDIVFLDPPFDAALLPQTCARLNDDDWLKPNALIYLEWRATTDAPQVPVNWVRIKSGQGGDSAFGLYQRS